MTPTEEQEIKLLQSLRAYAGNWPDARDRTTGRFIFDEIFESFKKFMQKNPTQNEFEIEERLKRLGEVYKFFGRHAWLAQLHVLKQQKPESWEEFYPNFAEFEKIDPLYNEQLYNMFTQDSPPMLQSWEIKFKAVDSKYDLISELRQRYGMNDYQYALKKIAPEYVDPTSMQILTNPNISVEIQKGITRRKEMFDKLEGKAIFYYEKVKLGCTNDQAINYLNKAIELDSNRWEYFSWRGAIKERTGDKKGALEDWQKCLTLNPRESSIYYDIGKLKSSDGKYEDAIEYFNKAINISQNLGLYRYARGEAKYEIGNKKGAMEDFIDAYKTIRNPYYLIRIQDLLIEFGVEGVDLFESYKQRASAKYRVGDEEGAIGDWEKALELNPNDDASLFIAINLGKLKNKQGKYAEAIDYFNKAIKLDSNVYDCYMHRGEAKYGIDDEEGAIEDWKKALELNPNDDASLFIAINLGKLKNKQGKYAEAIDYFNKIIKLNYKKSDYYFIRGEAKYKIGDKEGAIEDWKKSVVEYDNTHPGKFEFSPAPKDTNCREICLVSVLVEALAKLGEKEPAIDLFFNAFLDYGECSFDGCPYYLLRAVIALEEPELGLALFKSANSKMANIELLKEFNALYYDFQSAMNSKNKTEFENIKKKLNERNGSDKNSELLNNMFEQVKSLHVMTKEGFKKQEEKSDILIADTKVANAKLDSIHSILIKWDSDIRTIKDSNLSVEKTVEKILEISNIQALGVISLKKGRYEEIKRSINLDLGSQHGLEDDAFERVVESIASAELLFDESRGVALDYSGIVILYCKAIEIIEREKVSAEKENIRQQVQMLDLGKRVFKDMEDATPYHNKEKNQPENLFWRPWLENFLKGERLKKFFEKRETKLDLGTYNTLLFIRKQPEKGTPAFETIKEIYYLYKEDRNGSAHTSKKSFDDAKRVRSKILGEEGKPEEGLIYKVLCFCENKS